MEACKNCGKRKGKQVIPKGILADSAIAAKVKEWYQDEGRDDYDEVYVLTAIRAAHIQTQQEKPHAMTDPNKYGMHFTKFLRQELGLRP